MSQLCSDESRELTACLLHRNTSAIDKPGVQPYVEPEFEVKSFDGLEPKEESFEVCYAHAVISVANVAFQK